ncbi:MAG: bifunctional diguanylate cyclase/phosphodiesterase [Butyrivibrio sp.]|nr:bifunctional diguanylate cyclase/phosphodiesterase [Butyrivibrio sp.]
MSRETIRNAKEYIHVDELTGLYNLNGVLSELQGHGEYAADADSVIIYLNVMNFKAYNQKYGFAGGNEFLRGLAQEIERLFPHELIARSSGDQFIILAKSLDDTEITFRLAALRDTVSKYEKALKMRLKAGIYLANGKEDDPVVMIDRAKMACDEIIKVYDKDYNFYDEGISKRNELRQYVIDNFETAFQQKYFTVYYQKEVRALTCKVCGYEALARWIDPDLGVISPAIFIEVLESVHLINKLDIYIIDRVCSDLRDDLDSGCVVSPVSVNLSQLDFELCDIKAEIDKCREKYDIPVDLLHIEITESAIASGQAFLGDQIKRFRDAGYQVWMDDFGAGYSSLNNLKLYDFDVLKIDMNFLREFETNKKSHVIIGTIVNMAKELGIHTLAEGVETKEQYDFLRRIGCEKLQGYYFGKPTPVSQIDRQDLTEDKCEDYRWGTYYDRIGDINVLGTTPLRKKKLDVFSNLPIGIVELKDERELSFLYANTAYQMMLYTLGFSNTIQADEYYSNPDIPEVKDFLKALQAAEKAGDSRAEVFVTTNGSVVNTKIRFLYRYADKAAFALVSRNMTFERANNTDESLSVAMTHMFSQYFRVDLFDEDGTVENIYLNGDQTRVADIEPDAKRAVEIYSNMYLYPDDRERFRKFYDISTVNERLKKAGGKYLVDYYHSAIPGEGGRMQMYMLLPFYYNDRWKYISCCRYADEISGDIWK